MPDPIPLRDAFDAAPAAADEPIGLTLERFATLAAPGAAPARLERKQAAVMAYLHHAGSTPRGRLATLLWPAAPASTARSNLRQCLARLRRIAPGVLSEDADAIALAASVVVTTEAGPTPLLEGYEYADCDDFARWLQARVDEARSSHQAALASALQAATQRGDLVAAQAQAEALLALDRESEEPYRALMEIAYLRGDFAAAVRLWDQCRDMLRRHYEVSPSAATQALGATILAAAPPASATRRPPALSSAAQSPATPPLPPAVPGNLGLFAPALYGRAAELAALPSALHSHRLVTLIGIGGISKTSLALTAAHAAKDGPAGGVWFVDLSVVSEPANLAGAVARVLGLNLPENSVDELVLALRFRPPLLLVLDNAEHLWEGVAALAAELVTQTLHLRLLVTSRRALGLADEQRIQLSGLPLPDASEPLDPQHSGALALFEARAAALKPGFRLTAANAPAIADICRRLDGLPLAIELAAARVPVLGVEALRDRLLGSLHVLGAKATRSPPRQQTLQAVFDWTHALLRPAAQAVLRRLSVFVGGFTLALAEQVASGSDTEPFVDALGALIENSLIVASDAEPPRYRLLEVTRAYALEKLVEAGELETVSDLHAQTLRRLFVQAEADLNERIEGASSRGQFLARLAPELDNLRAAIAWSKVASREPALVIALAAASTEALRLLGLANEALRLMLELRGAVDDAVPAETAELFWTGLCALGTHGRLSREEILEVIGKAESLYLELGSPRRIHVGLYRKGFALVHLGDFEAAGEALRHMEGVEAPGWPVRAIVLRLNLQGGLDAALGRFEASIEAYRIAVGLLAFEPEESDVVLNVLANLCMSLVGAERHEEALAVAADVLAGGPSPVVRNIAQRASVVASIFLGRLDEAAAIARGAMTGWRSDDMLPHMLSAFAWLAFLQGRVADALRIDGAARAQVLRMGLSNMPAFDRARTNLARAIAERAVPAAEASKRRREGERLPPDELVAMCVGG